MYNILEHEDHIKAVKEKHSSEVDATYAQSFMQIAVGFGAVFIGIAALVAVVRF